ncbi:MAG: NAD(P)/FAD-dependent oxidoreductase [Chloroflexota bacterium]
MSEKADITIIGAGVVGLAIAARVAKPEREVFVLEKNGTFGQETSSRHSGVIHAGIYYPEGSLKAKLCVAGNRMLYRLCQEHGIDHRKLGKLIIATSAEEREEMTALWEQGIRNGVEGLQMLSSKEIERLEPNVRGVAAILSPATGIIDSHALMQLFIAQAQAQGAEFVYQTRVVGIEHTAGGCRVTVADRTGESQLDTRVIINSAGLYSDTVAGLAGIDVIKAGYQLSYCKGEYFSVGNGKNRMVNRLIFPVPPPRVTGVGIHVTLDITGRMRLGPSIEYVTRLDYSVDSSHQGFFYEAVKGFLPFIEYDDLAPEMAGIRPKLQRPGEEVKDFVIREESKRGLPGFINLIGIESPGLTASPAIGEYVSQMVSEILG